MLINIWSTPRTGSNWLCAYIKSLSPKKTTVIHQFLNYYNLQSYIIPNHGDYVYEFTKNAYYCEYRFDHLKKGIVFKNIYEKRDKTVTQEATHRKHLLLKHDHEKNPTILHNHVMPMDSNDYEFLKKIGTRNIYLYRKNILKQLSSYALAYATTNWHHRQSYSNIFVEPNVIHNLAERIIHWHKLDKTNCEILAYEDLDFSNQNFFLPKKQNLIDPFDQLCDQTKQTIYEIDQDLKKSLTELAINSTSLSNNSG